MACWRYVGAVAEFYPQLSLTAQPGYVYDFGGSTAPVESPPKEGTSPSVLNKWISDPGPATDYRISQYSDIKNLTGNPVKRGPFTIPTVDRPFMGQSGHPFTASGGTTNNSNDTTDFILGSRALSTITNGAGSQAKIAGTFGSVLDMTGKSLVVWVKMDNQSNFLGGYPRIFLGDTTLTNVYYWKLTPAAGQPLSADGEWMRFTLPFGTATTVGAPSRSSLAALTIQVYDNSSGSVGFHLGGLATMSEPTAFPNGVVSLTFDDAYLSQFTTAKPIMDASGYPATAFVIDEVAYNNGNFNTYMTVAQLKQLENYSGWEVATHAHSAVNHNASYTGIADSTAYLDMQASQVWVAANGFRSPNLHAYPVGNFNANTVANAQSLFTAARTTTNTGGFPDETLPPADLHRLRGLALGSTVSLATAEAAVDRAFANKSWLVLIAHDIVTTPTGSNQWSTANFQSLITYIATKGIPVRTVTDVLRSL